MRPENTTNLDPMIKLFTPVEAMERSGQGQLVNSESLPTEVRGKEALEAAGVKFGEPYPDDPLFCPAQLPVGWSKRGTDHAMHSDLIDDKGRVRAGIFYKAAHYDRRADMGAVRRYGVSQYGDSDAAGNHVDDPQSPYRRVVITDCGKPIHLIGVYKARDYAVLEPLEKDAEAWLKERFPDWESAAAYWD